MPNGKYIPEKRHTRRFPLELPIAVNGGGVITTTHDISAGGVLFYSDADVEVGAAIEFTIAMPAMSLGAPQDVQVKCVGRVVRSCRQGSRHAVAVVIDEYQFERA